MGSVRHFIIVDQIYPGVRSSFRKSLPEEPSGTLPRPPLLPPVPSLPPPPNPCSEEWNDQRKWSSNRELLWAAGWFATSIAVWLNAETVIG